MKNDPLTKNSVLPILSSLNREKLKNGTVLFTNVTVAHSLVTVTLIATLIASVIDRRSMTPTRISGVLTFLAILIYVQTVKYWVEDVTFSWTIYWIACPVSMRVNATERTDRCCQFDVATECACDQKPTCQDGSVSVRNNVGCFGPCQDVDICTTFSSRACLNSGGTVEFDGRCDYCHYDYYSYNSYTP